MPLCSLTIFRKSHQSISVSSMRFGNGSQKISLGGNFTPPPLGRGRVELNRAIGSWCILELDGSVKQFDKLQIPHHENVNGMQFHSKLRHKKTVLLYCVKFGLITKFKDIFQM